VKRQLSTLRLNLEGAEALTDGADHANAATVLLRNVQFRTVISRGMVLQGHLAEVKA